MWPLRCRRSSSLDLPFHRLLLWQSSAAGASMVHAELMLTVMLMLGWHMLP